MTTTLVFCALFFGVFIGFLLCAILSGNKDIDEEPIEPVPDVLDTNRLDTIIRGKYNVTHTGGMCAVLDHETHEIKAIGADLRANIDRVRASFNG